MDYKLRYSVLNDWFVEGIHRGARYLIIIFDQYEQEERPVFVFPEQDITVEVVKQINNQTVQLKAVVDLLDDAKRQILAINRPEKMFTSKVVH